MFPKPLWCIQVFPFFPPPLEALNCRKSPHEMAREWKSNEATSCRWEMGWEEGTTFIICLSEMPASHRWNCCQLPQTPFGLTRLLGAAWKADFFPLQSRTPPEHPLPNNHWKHTCVLSNRREMKHHQKYITAFTGATWPGMSCNSRTFVVDVPSLRKLKVALQSE